MGPVPRAVTEAPGGPCLALLIPVLPPVHGPCLPLSRTPACLSLSWGGRGHVRGCHGRGSQTLLGMTEVGSVTVLEARSAKSGRRQTPPPRGCRSGSFLSCPFHLLVTPSVPCLWLRHSGLCLRVREVLLCVSVTLLTRTPVIGFGADPTPWWPHLDSSYLRSPCFVIRSRS